MCQRRRNLQQTETDPRRLRSLSGAWFTEERMKRHHIWSGSALVHATIRHRRTKSRGPLTVYAMLLLQACGTSFSCSYRDSPLMLFCCCCYSNRCIPERAVQWRERKNHPQPQHHSWCWEKTAPAKRRGEWRVSVGRLSVTEKSFHSVWLHLTNISLFCFVFRSQVSLKPSPIPRTKSPRAKVCVHILASLSVLEK